MQYSDHLHHGSWGCQDENSSDERGCSRVPRKTIRSSLVAEKGPCRTRYVSNLGYSSRVGSLNCEVSVGDYATVMNAVPDQAERAFERIIGNSAALESVLEQVEQVAPTDSTVLIEGETGTGKELIAHAIHNASQRCGRAFIKLNCAAIPLDLLE